MRAVDRRDVVERGVTGDARAGCRRDRTRSEVPAGAHHRLAGREYRKNSMAPPSPVAATEHVARPQVDAVDVDVFGELVRQCQLVRTLGGGTGTAAQSNGLLGSDPNADTATR